MSKTNDVMNDGGKKRVCRNRRHNGLGHEMIDVKVR